ncbi:MAG: TetR/AcrR family transcriptional regulator [Alphaproteobacteria bacterium]
MARRSEHTREELTGMAIDAGCEMIAEKGFQQFSARGVAAKIGYTVGTLYHLFGTLDQFILHINARTLDSMYDEVAKGVAKKPAAGQLIHHLAHGYLAFAKKNYNLWSALFEHRLEDGSTEVPDWYAPKMTRLFGLIEESVLPQVKGDRKKAARLARLLWASVHGITTLSLAGKLEIVQADHADKMIDDLLEVTLGYKKK